MIPARMRAGASWSDALILNMSSRGMMVRSDSAPSRGSYLEIRRGNYVIVARVVWAEADRFGVRTQDAVPADGLIRNPDAAEPAVDTTPSVLERRAAYRPVAVRHEASRWRARALEFGTFALVSTVAATAGLSAIDALLAKPLQAVQTALGGR